MEFPRFPELQLLSICPRVMSDTPQLEANGPLYRLIAENVQRSCPSLKRIHFPGVMATLVQKGNKNNNTNCNNANTDNNNDMGANNNDRTGTGNGEASNIEGGFILNNRIRV